jgi:hypothetical protein
LGWWRRRCRGWSSGCERGCERRLGGVTVAWAAGGVGGAAGWGVSRPADRRRRRGGEAAHGGEWSVSRGGGVAVVEGGLRPPVIQRNDGHRQSRRRGR